MQFARGHSSLSFSIPLKADLSFLAFDKSASIKFDFLKDSDQKVIKTFKLPLKTANEPVSHKTRIKFWQKVNKRRRWLGPSDEPLSKSVSSFWSVEFTVGINIVHTEKKKPGGDDTFTLSLGANSLAARSLDFDGQGRLKTSFERTLFFSRLTLGSDWAWSERKKEQV